MQNRYAAAVTNPPATLHAVKSIVIGLALGLAVVPMASAKELPWVIRDVTVIPADTGEILTHRTVVIRDGRIEAISPADRPLAKAPGERVIDGRGKYLIPGLFDAHVHLATEGEIRGSGDPALAALPLDDDHSYDKQVLLTFLKAGVTSVANLGGSRSSDEDLLWLRQEVAADRILGPRLFVGKRINGPHAEVALKRGDVPASTPDKPTTAADGIAAVRAAAAKGYDFIKPYQHLNRGTYLAIIEEARHSGLPTTGHLPERGCAVCVDRSFFFAHPLDNVAHSEELSRYARENDLSPHDMETLANQIAQKRTSVTPTLITLKTIVHMYLRREVPAVPDGWDALVDPVTRRDWYGERNRYLSSAFRGQDGADQFPAGYDFSRLLTRELWKRGVPLTVGTDAPLPGLAFGISMHQEMIELRALGLPPIDVLRAASINAHRLFDDSNETGAVRPGQSANLVLLDANPVDDIQNISRISGVFSRGRWLPMASIDGELQKLKAANIGLIPSAEEATKTSQR